MNSRDADHRDLKLVPDGQCTCLGTWIIDLNNQVLLRSTKCSELQTLHNFVREIRIFSVKIDLYQSVSCIDVSRHFSRDSYRDVICQKNRDIA